MSRMSRCGIISRTGGSVMPLFLCLLFNGMVTAENSMSGVHSSYYPPRRRWYRPYALAALGRALRRRSALLRGMISLRQYLPSLAVPGHAFGQSGQPRFGRGIQISYALSLLVFLATPGSWMASVALGVMTA